ncbi:hypothetical protein GC174_00390 [bacterium]|nr:hypothetical protein [bacterium]
MILTRKGSTTGNLNILLTLAIVLLTTRLILEQLEKSRMVSPGSGVKWHRLVDMDEKDLQEHIDYFVEKEKEKKKGKEENKEEKPSLNSERYLRIRSIDLKAVIKDYDQKPLFIMIDDKASPQCDFVNRITLTNPEMIDLIEKNFFPLKISVDKVVNKTEYAFLRAYCYAYPLIVCTPSFAVVSTEGSYLDGVYGITDSGKLILLVKRALKKADEENQRKIKNEKEEKGDNEGP